MKRGRYLAALLLAVTTLMAAAGAQDGGAPSSGQTEPNSAQAGSPQGGSDQGSVPQDQGLPPDEQADRPQLQTREGNSQPQSRVARVSLINGNVSMQRGDSSDWSAVTLNTPLVQGDQIATAEKSRAEVQLDFANVMRLAGGSQVKIADLDRTRIQVQVSMGYASYSIYKGNEADVEIDTPNVAVHPTRPGRYRVQVNSDNETDVIVREGEAELTTPQGSTTVKEGQVIAIHGADNPEYKVENAPPGDNWDRWNNDRDRSIENATSWRNTNRYYTGSSDLDANGRWIYVPGYGQVWQPYQQGPDWAPYQDGRWVWEPGWGWTWVSYEPWGWAPYHYGRWFYWNSGWVWWPGPVYPYYRPLWAPAYVSFFGFGGVFGFGFGFGSVGWLPCGPFDPFFPWWGFGFNRVNVVNINVFNVRTFHGPFIRPLGIAGRQPFISNTHLALTNPRVRAGITSVSGADFARGGMGSRERGISEAQLRGSHMMTANVPVVPTRESLRSGGAARFGGAGGFQPSTNSRFVTRNAPPSGPPAFHQQAAQMEHVVQNAGRTMGESSNVRFGNNEAVARGQNNSPVFSRPGTTQIAQNGNPGSQGGQGSRDGWRSFGGNNSSPATNAPHGPASPASGSGVSNGGRNQGGGWPPFSGRSSVGGNTGKPQLQMAKPLVTPRSTTPSYTYARPSSPPPSSPRDYGSYNSSLGNSSGAYNGRSYSGGGYGGGAYSGRGYSGGGYAGGGYSGRGYGSGGYSGGYTGGGYSGSYGGGRSVGGYSGGGYSSGGRSGGSYGGGSHSGGGHSSGGSSGGGHGNNNGHR